MSTFAILQRAYEFNRGRTLALLDQIEQLPNPAEALGWRPGDGRAHIAWQLMHIGVTEEIFATERLAPDKSGAFTELWPRFRGGSTPDEQIPSPSEIRAVLEQGRAHLLETLALYDDSRLGEIPPPLAQRGLTMLDVLHILSWHEAHHQGQAHLTLNLYKAQAANL
ncbi:MAG: DinB family protein [Planctomycetales bacterium]|nr:DinB family protein [Planctomycetales bacterium]